MVQNGVLAVCDEKIFFKLLRLAKLDKVKEITVVQAMKDTGLTKPTFYSLVKRYR